MNASLLTMLFLDTKEEMYLFMIWFVVAIISFLIIFIIRDFVKMFRNEKINDAWRKTLKPGDEATFSEGGNYPSKECTVDSVNEDGSVVVKMKVWKRRLYMKKEKKK